MVSNAERLSRRRFMGGAAGAAGAAALGPGSLLTPKEAGAKRKPDARYRSTLRVDIHSHYTPDPWMDYINRHGGWFGVGLAPLTTWNVEQHLAFMDQYKIDASVVGIYPPACSIGEVAERVETAQAINEAGAALVSAHGSRFGVLACLPLPDIDSAVAEARRALDELRLDGVGLQSNFGGRFLGDPMFRPLYEELNARSATCFVHPFNTPGVPPVGFSPTEPWPPPYSEWPKDTSRTAESLIYSGVMRDYPNIRFILAHAGGVLGALAFRLAQAHAFSTRFNEVLPEGPYEYLRRFYYDTAQAYSPGQMRAVLDMAPVEQIVCGTDVPAIARFYQEARSLVPIPDPADLPSPDIGDPAPALDKVFNHRERRKIDADNPLALFPRLRARMARVTGAGLATRALT